MARIRTIKPDFWTDEKLAECSPNARLLFIGMLNFSDDNGNLPRSSKKLKMQIYPSDNLDCEKLVLELFKNDLAKEYEIGSDKYIHIKGFIKHQKIDRPTKSNIPISPFDDDSTNTQAEIGDYSTMEGKGMESNGREENNLDAPNALAEKKPKSKTKKPITTLPEGWRPNDEHRTKCKELGFDADKLTDEPNGFINHHLAKGNTFADWDRAFWTWIGNAQKFGAANGKSSGRPHIEQQNSSIAEAGLRVASRYQR